MAFVSLEKSSRYIRNAQAFGEHDYILQQAAYTERIFEIFLLHNILSKEEQLTFT